jgi:hypothetical protein
MFGTTNASCSIEENCCCRELGGTATEKEAIAIFQIEDGVESCTVGLISRVQMQVPKAVQSVNRLCIVSEFCDISENRYVSGVAKRNY